MNSVNLIKYFIILITFFALSHSQMQAQQRFSIGVIPEFNLDYKLSERVFVKHGFELQEIFYNKEDNFNLQFNKIDVQNILGFITSEKSSVGVGYLFRIKEGNRYYHRMTQQFSFKKAIAGLPISHRLRTDQTFSDEKPTFRFRYRVKTVFKFKEEALSTGDKYLVTSLETLYIRESQSDDIENRVYLGLGFLINSKSDFEIGLDWRTDDYLVSGFRNRLWFTASYSYHL
ncbi:DUF2490 domain-containing protein [Psychroflexus halocasei]|uniref:DUF2490 domain-containing protein n=1 Tax=Psychroflexus halocasei TaxID=908615 RepID=A0A1H3Y3J5_9FLAO|nr:DUF2490 domain-containing protein [Psychroflexus halocasei]SEA05651.1 Protein of unknown function [Psychroflexus halocasei]